MNTIYLTLLIFAMAIVVGMLVAGVIWLLQKITTSEGRKN